jgi:hypothetical protein
MACDGVKNTRRPLGLQEWDDIADQFVFGEQLRFAQTKEFLNPRHWLELSASETRDGHFLSISKTPPFGEFAGSSVGQ